MSDNAFDNVEITGGIDDELFRQVKEANERIERRIDIVGGCAWIVIPLAVAFLASMIPLSRYSVKLFAATPPIRVGFRVSSLSDGEVVMLLTNRDATKGYDLCVTRKRPGRDWESYDEYIGPAEVGKELGFCQIKDNFVVGDKGRVKVGDYLLVYKYKITKDAIVADYELPYQHIYDACFWGLIIIVLLWTMNLASDALQNRCFNRILAAKGISLSDYFDCLRKMS